MTLIVKIILEAVLKAIGEAAAVIAVAVAEIVVAQAFAVPTIAPLPIAIAATTFHLPEDKQ